MGDIRSIISGRLITFWNTRPGYDQITQLFLFYILIIIDLIFNEELGSSWPGQHSAIPKIEQKICKIQL